MANYVGIVYTDDGHRYGWDTFVEGNKTPQFYLKNDSQSPDLNIEDFDNEDVRNGLDEYRNGYPEPQGDVTVTAHTKSAPTIFYGVLGNYIYTANAVESATEVDGNDNPVTLNVHEFWVGENLERPEWCGEFAYSDFLLKRIYGGIWDSMTWNATLDKTTIELGLIYREEAVKDIYLEQYKQNFNLLKALPLVGYDYEVAILDLDAEEEELIADYASQCFKEVTITVENNHATGEDARCLGSMLYGYKPRMESCNIELEATTKFDRRNYEFIVGAMHNGYNPNQNRWNKLQACQTFDKKVVIRARSCIDPDEYIYFKFPKCRVTLDPIDGDSNIIEATLKLQPYTTEQVLLFDEQTRKTTPMYVQVVTKAPRVDVDRYY